MRYAPWIVLTGLATHAAADPAPSWNDVPALLSATTAPLESTLRTCITGKLPRTISVIVARTERGTRASMPLYGVGYRGISPEERCLVRAVATIALADLPAEVEQVLLGIVIGAAGTPAPEPDRAFEDWKDLPAAVTAGLDSTRRASLAACDAKPRTVRVIVDRTARATRMWLPAWQFHSPNGDGATPPAEQRVKTCMTRAMKGWTAPALPAVLGEIQVAIRISRVDDQRPRVP